MAGQKVARVLSDECMRAVADQEIWNGGGGLSLLSTLPCPPLPFLVHLVYVSTFVVNKLIQRNKPRACHYAIMRSRESPCLTKLGHKMHHN